MHPPSPSSIPHPHRNAPRRASDHAARFDALGVAAPPAPLAGPRWICALTLILGCVESEGDGPQGSTHDDTHALPCGHESGEDSTDDAGDAPSTGAMGDLGTLPPPPGRGSPPQLEVVAFDLVEERERDGAPVWLSNLHYQDHEGGIEGRLELTCRPGRGATLAVFHEGQLDAAVTTGDGAHPARFATLPPDLYSPRRAFAGGALRAHLDLELLASLDAVVFPLTLRAVRAHRDRLRGAVEAGGGHERGCAARLDELTHGLEFTLDLACGGGRTARGCAEARGRFTGALARPDHP